jgi:hypothetical protein
VIHAAKLPEKTRQRLTEVVHLQFSLLRWASKISDPTEDKCLGWLGGQKRFQNKGNCIAAWIWASKERKDALCEFALGPTQAKQWWVKDLCRSAFLLLRKSTGNLSTAALTEEWQKAGAQFLLHYYQDLRKGGIPGYSFSATETAKYTALDLLEAFVLENDRLCVCPACDESPFFTFSRNAIRSELDHYFPKSLYPHLSIHPYNLIPLCHGCNSWVKGDHDPLKGPNGRRSLEDIWLPYRERGLSYSTYLDVSLELGNKKATFKRILPRPGNNLRDKVLALGEVFELPSRWEKRRDEIGEKLFRRMRNYLRGDVDFHATKYLDEITSQLDELLYLFNEEDLSREPFVYPMMWWLTKLMNEELRMNEKSEPEQSPLWDEILSWSKDNSTQAKEWQSKGREIRAIMA